MDTFELDVLGAVSNDYEAIHTIRSDLERDLGRAVSGAEVATALIRLTSAGLVTTFVFDRSIGDYRSAPLSSDAVENLWFMINATGRTEYERLVA